MNRMFDVTGAAVQLAVDGAAPMRALGSECTSIINAMRGKLDNKKRWQVAIIASEIPSGKTIRAGLPVTVGGVSGKIEEEDLVLDSGVWTFFVS